MRRFVKNPLFLKLKTLPTLTAAYILTFLCLGCNKNLPHKNEIFSSSSPICSQLVVDNEFLVHWKNGSVTLEKFDSIDTFKNSLLKSRSKDILWAEPNYYVSLSPSKPPSQRVCNEEHVNNWGIQSIEAPSGWQRGARGQNVVVAVIDSGIDPHHLQLSSNIFVNQGETGIDEDGSNKSHNGIDDDDNGYIDDVRGYNFVNSSPYPIDNLGHGTLVAGIIAAQHDDNEYNTQRVQGVAPKAQILPLKFIEGNTGGETFAIIEAIDYAILMGVQVINASWGGPLCSITLRSRIESLIGENILFISAAGNSGHDIDNIPSYPASFQLLPQITVGAIDPYEDKAIFSNYGETSVHIFAPGQDIVSTIPMHFGATTACSDGTSMATPFVAGVAAALWSHEPDASIMEIKSSILNSVSKNSRYQNSTGGRLNMNKALDELNRFMED